MLKSILFFAFLLAMALSACNKSEPLPPKNNTFNNPCLTQTFSNRLKKTIAASSQGNGFPTFYQTTEYFYDIQGRVDSILYYDSSAKVGYDSEGQVVTYTTYWLGQGVSSIRTYTYENGLLKQTVTKQFDQAGNLHNWVHTTNFEWNEQGFIKKFWQENGNDVTVLTLDDCGNTLESRDFYNSTGVEHRLSQSAYTTTISPYFLIGLHKVFPTDYSVNNWASSEIVHWDCGADYIGGVFNTEYEYNSENLPTKATNYFHTVEFIYE